MLTFVDNFDKFWCNSSCELLCNYKIHVILKAHGTHFKYSITDTVEPSLSESLETKEL